MKSFSILFTALLSIFSITGFSQSISLPIPEEVTEAIKAGTRSWTGVPGENYFQNHTDYAIEAQLIPEADSVRGVVKMRYHNDSPDELDQLVIRLYQDMYKKGFESDNAIKKDDQTSGVGIPYLLVNGDTINQETHTTRPGTNLIVMLDEPIASGSTVSVEVSYEFHVPTKTLERMGRYYKGSYFLAYWYPQMAVYDDVFGWDLLEYRGTVEFYNDFGDFDLKLTAPQEYYLWSTGVLQNPEEIYAEPYLSRYLSAWESDEVITIVGKEEAKEDVQITQDSESGLHTWHYIAEHVPDVAFAAAYGYIWDAASVVVDDESGRRVLTEACFRPTAKDFYKVAGYAQEIVRDLSTETPGIPYPYPKITVYHGDKSGGGMEYPMMVNDASVFSELFAFSLTYHEIAHTYFPFYMGINERRYAWMDEGWATFLPEDLMVKKGFFKQPMQFSGLGYTAIAGTEREKPMMTESHELGGMAYGIASYPKPGLAYMSLRDILGDDFNKVLTGYMDRWNGKHPGPYDFFFSFNDLSGQDLNWFWKPWFFETTQPDLVLEPIKIKGKSAKFNVVNAGGLPVPVYLTIEFVDGSSVERHFSPVVWAEGAESIEFDEKFDKKITSIEMGRRWIPDVNSGDNKWKLGRD